MGTIRIATATRSKAYALSWRAGWATSQRPQMDAGLSPFAGTESRMYDTCTTVARVGRHDWPTTHGQSLASAAAQTVQTAQNTVKTCPMFVYALLLVVSCHNDLSTMEYVTRCLYQQLETNVGSI